MASDDLSLLWKLRADNTDAKAKLAETRAAVTSLRTSFGSDLAVMEKVGTRALRGISGEATALIRNVPFIGGALASVTQEAIKQAGISAAGRVQAEKQAAEQIIATEKSLQDRLNALQKYTKKPGLPDRFVSIDAPGGSGGTGVFNGGAQAAAETAAITAKTVAVEANTAATIAQAAATTTAAGAEGSAVIASSALTAARGAEAVATEGAAVAATELASAETVAGGAVGGLGAALSGLALPIAIAVAALAGVVAVLYELEKTLVENADAFSQYGDEIDRASQKTKLNYEALQALKKIADDNHTSFEGLVTGLGKYLRNLDAAAHGNKAMRDEFEQLGIDAENAATSPQAAILQLFAAYEKLGPTIQENTVAQKLLGRAGIELIPALRDIHGNLDEASASAKKFGRSLSDDAIRNAVALDNQLDDLRSQLLGIKLAIGAAAAPAVIQLVHAFTDLLHALKPLFELIGVVGIPILNQLANAMRGLAIIVALASGNYAEFTEQVKRANEAAAGTIPEIKLPGAPGVAPNPQTEEERAKNASEGQVSALKAASEEAKRIAADRIAAEENALKLGTQTRKATTENIIAQSQIRAAADKNAIDAEIARKRDEQLALDKFDAERVKKANAIEEEILNLTQQKQNIDSEVERDAQKRRTELQVEEKKNLLEHQKAKLDILLNAGQAQIQIIESQIRNGEQAAEQGEKDIEAIENAGFKARLGIKQQELNAAGVEPAERQKIKDEIEKIEQERTANAQRQADRRIANAEKEAQSEREILLNFNETALRIGQIRDNAQIAAIQALASLRVKTEEQAAKEILKIRLDALDREANAIRARQSLTGEIKDPQARAKQEAELSNQLRIIAAERVAIQAQGERDTTEGHKRDIEIESQYVADLISIRQRIASVLRDNHQLIINQMILHHAHRRDIIREQLKLDLQDEEDRHRQATNAIDAERKENEKSNRTQEEKDAKEKELHLLEEAEARRHDLAMKGIKEQGERDQKKADPIGKIGINKEDIRDLIDETEKSITSSNQILSDSFNQVANAIGSVIQQYILYGHTGPAVLRKILAAALATIAQEAAINAIKELAIGFALLAVGDPGAAAAFTSAAIWGGIAGVAAIAGRVVAGNAFNQDSKSSTGGFPGSSGGSGSGSSSDQTRIIEQGRNQVIEHVHILRVESNDSHIVNVIQKDAKNNGKTRDLIIEIAGA